MFTSGPCFKTKVTDFAYKSISLSIVADGIPLDDTFTWFTHSGSVYHKTYEPLGILYCPLTISFELLNIISFSVEPSANFKPLLWNVTVYPLTSFLGFAVLISISGTGLLSFSFLSFHFFVKVTVPSFLASLKLYTKFSSFPAA